MIHQILINDTNELPKQLPEFCKICIDRIKNIYTGVEHHLYCGEELEEIICQNFDSDVLCAYKKLKPYACKADLSRLCLLYLYGGLYIDLNVYFIEKIPDLKRKKFFAFRDWSKLSKRSWSIQNGIIYSHPKMKVIEDAISIIVDNCKREYYGNQCVDVSATTVLGSAIMKTAPDREIFTDGELDVIDYSSFDEKTKNELSRDGYGDANLRESCLGFFMDHPDKLIALRKPTKGGDLKTLGYMNTNNYVTMWEEKNIYNRISFNEPKINYF
jgi:hypothetical protein